jgi:hypothetical protein
LVEDAFAGGSLSESYELSGEGGKNLPGRFDVRPSCFSVLRPLTTEAGGFFSPSRELLPLGTDP